MIEPVNLWHREPHAPLDDQRQFPFEPVAVGAVALLSFRTEHGGPGYTHEFLHAEVIAVADGAYRGKVVSRVRDDLISPEKLTTGTVLEFNTSHILALFDTKPKY